MIARASSGSRSSISSVEPLMSANSAVTVLRSPSIASEVCRSGATRTPPSAPAADGLPPSATRSVPSALPQSAQNFAPGALSALQFEQRFDSGLPHSAQNFLPGIPSVPHFEQRMCPPKGRRIDHSSITLRCPSHSAKSRESLGDFRQTVERTGRTLMTRPAARAGEHACAAPCLTSRRGSWSMSQSGSARASSTSFGDVSGWAFAMTVCPFGRPCARKACKARRTAMKAAVFHGPEQPLTIEDVDIDKPQDREVLLRTVASGVCHSDLHFVDGYYTHPAPAVLGHEAAGIVEEVGKAVSYIKPG